MPRTAGRSLRSANFTPTAILLVEGPAHLLGAVAAEFGVAILRESAEPQAEMPETDVSQTTCPIVAD